MSTKQGYRAIVGEIVSTGRHGPYAVAHSKEIGSVTFSLGRDVWQEESLPDPGSHVMLSQVRKKSAGWRAEHGRFFEPSDEQQPANKEQQQ